MSTLSDIKTALREMLPSGQRLKVDKHKEVNDKLLDYMFIPFGVPFPFLGPETKIPSNCAKCDGRELTKIAYPYLFEELGNLWGGDGITTFNLPLIPAGASIVQKGTSVSNSISTTFSEGTTGGTTTKILTTDNTPPHSHYNGMADNDTTLFVYGGSIIQPTMIPPSLHTSHIQSESDNGTSYQGSTSVEGLATAFNVMNPYIVGNWIMRLY